MQVHNWIQTASVNNARSPASCGQLNLLSVGTQTWRNRASAGTNPNVCGASKNYRGECLGVLPLAADLSRCSAMGARLCSAQELANGEALSTGCGYNTFRVWSSQSCVSESGFEGLTTILYDNNSTECGTFQEGTTAALRCCADSTAADTTQIVLDESEAAGAIDQFSDGKSSSQDKLQDVSVAAIVMIGAVVAVTALVALMRSRHAPKAVLDRLDTDTVLTDPEDHTLVHDSILRPIDDDTYSIGANSLTNGPIVQAPWEWMDMLERPGNSGDKPAYTMEQFWSRDDSSASGTESAVTTQPLNFESAAHDVHVSSKSSEPMYDRATHHPDYSGSMPKTVPTKKSTQFKQTSLASATQLEMTEAALEWDPSG